MKKLGMSYLRWAVCWGTLIFCSTTYAPATYAFDISWNGFGSVYYGQAFNSNLLPSGFTDTHVNFTSFSLMGLNANAKISDELSFGAQFVALGSSVGTADNFSIMAQWAHLSYSPVEGLLIKGGRQLYPVLLASEYVRVAYLLPYRRIPFPIFLISPFTRFDGASVNYTADVGIGKLTFGLFGGTPVLDANTAILSTLKETSVLEDLLGAQVTLDGDGWRVRGMVSRNFTGATSTAVPAAFTALGGHEQTYSVGYRFDKHNIVSWGEYLMVRTPDGSSVAGGRYVGNGHGYYIFGGYRLGKFMPRYTFSQGSSNFNFPYGSLAAVTANGSITTHTVGINYQAGAQAVVKAEYEFSLVPSAPGQLGYFATGPFSATDTSGNAFYVGVDFIF